MSSSAALAEAAPTRSGSALRPPWPPRSQPSARTTFPPPRAKSSGSACSTSSPALSRRTRCRGPGRRQALATAGAGPCSIIGTSVKAPAIDAVFANSVAGHGLVREDMHTGSVSHLGIVVLPPLLALAQSGAWTGGASPPRRSSDTRSAAASAGRSSRRNSPEPSGRPVSPDRSPRRPPAAGCSASTRPRPRARCRLRPTSSAGRINGPTPARDEMFFDAGIAARNGLTAARLAALGAYGSEKALDGEAGLLTAYRPDHKAPDVRLFEGEPEIMSVFFKPVPVCNFAQTPCLAAVGLAKDKGFDPSEVVSVDVSASHAAKAYPGCDYPGPFARVLQAKMSIQYAVASALLRGRSTKRVISSSTTRRCLLWRRR